MTQINEELVLRYSLQLGKLRDALNGHDRASVDLLQTWREELRQISDQEELKAHATRTARNMGGMGSLAEVVMMGKDPHELRLLQELYAICKLIRSS
jgi:hypothetical protein